MVIVKIVIDIIILLLIISIGDGLEKSERLHRREYARLQREVVSLKKRVSELEEGNNIER